MAKRTISFSDYEEPTWEEYTGPDPKIGSWHNAELKRCKFVEGDGGTDQLMFVFEITEGDFKGWGRARYADFDGEHKWRMHQILRALQGGKTTDVTVDWENEKAVELWIKKQKPVKIKVGSYNERVNIDKVAPLLELAGGTATSKAAPKEAELPGDVDAGDEPVEDYTEDELKGMSADDLEEILVEEFEVPEDELPAKPARDRTGAKYKQALIDAILEEQEGDENQDAVESAAEGDDGFDDGFEEDPEPEPEPEPAPRARRGRAAAAAPKAEPAPAETTRRRRR